MLSPRFCRVLWRTTDIISALILFAIFCCVVYIIYFHGQDRSGPASDAVNEIGPFLIAPFCFSIFWLIARITLVFDFSEPDEAQRNRKLTFYFLFGVVLFPVVIYSGFALDAAIRLRR